jgi:hypothetical protein
MAAIATAVIVAARRAPATPVQPAPGVLGDQDVAEPVDPTDGFNGYSATASHNGTSPAHRPDASRPVPAPPGATPSDSGPSDSGPSDSGPSDSGPSDSSPSDSALPDWRQGAIQLAAISLATGVLSYRVMELIGRPVNKYGLKIDEPFERWTAKYQIPFWAKVMLRFNNVGSSWTTWAAAGASGICLATSWSRQKWLPPSLLMSVIVVDKYTTKALRRHFRRLGPPTSPLGTYPAGGPERTVLFTALIANMLWREFSGTERGKVLAVGGIGALAFNMAYCRAYLRKHWLTDITSGLVYGAVMYAPFAVAIRAIAGPPVHKPAGQPPDLGSRLADRLQAVSASVAPVASVRR